MRTECEKLYTEGICKYRRNRISPWSCQPTKSEQFRLAANSDYRKREYLTPAEIEKLIAVAKGNRYGHRDATMILVAFRHGLRASEICELEWSDIDFAAAEMHVERKKRGKSPRHPACFLRCGCDRC
jgi:integrase